MKIGIIGGGISGVSLAVKLGVLKEQGKDIEVTLLEADKRLGGTIDSVHKDGYVIESGTNGFLDSKPFTLEVFQEANLLEKLVKSNDKARIRYIQRYNQLQRLPEGAGAFLSSKLLSFSGKMRIAKEIFVAQKKDDSDETLSSFATRRLGKEALDYLIGPMVSGIFAGDPEKMSLESCFPVIADLEKTYGGLIKGMIKKPKKKSGPAGPGGVLTTYEGGMGEAVKDLAKSAEKKGVKIHLESPVTSVTKKDNKYIVSSGSKEYEFDVLSVCAPAYASAKFLKELDSELSEVLSTIPYAPMFVAGLGFDSDSIENDLNGFGYLIPKQENMRILGALFTSSMFPVQAPSGKKFLRIMAGGDTNHALMEKSEEELLKICIEDVTKVLGVKKDPYMVQYFKVMKAIPQYHVGHREKVAKIEEISSKLGNFYVGGNVLYGIGLNDCTKTSKIIAEKIEENL